MFKELKEGMAKSYQKENNNEQCKVLKRMKWKSGIEKC